MGQAGSGRRQGRAEGHRAVAWVEPSVSSVVRRSRSTGLARSSAMPARLGAWSPQWEAVLAFSAPQDGQACRMQNMPSPWAGELQAPFAEDRPHVSVTGGECSGEACGECGESGERSDETCGESGEASDEARGEPLGSGSRGGSLE